MNENNPRKNFQFIQRVAKKLRNPLFENIDLTAMYKILHNEKITTKHQPLDKRSFHHHLVYITNVIGSHFEYIIQLHANMTCKNSRFLSQFPLVLPFAIGYKSSNGTDSSASSHKHQVEICYTLGRVCGDCIVYFNMSSVTITTPK